MDNFHRVGNEDEPETRFKVKIMVFTEGTVIGPPNQLSLYPGMHIPTTHPVLAPILSVVPLQLLAYCMAVARGSDVDQPRNLAKSVTVE